MQDKVSGNELPENWEEVLDEESGETYYVRTQVISLLSCLCE